MNDVDIIEIHYTYGDFTQIPNSFIYNRDLSFEARSLFIYLASFAYSTNKVYPTMKQICADTKWSDQRIRKYRDELQQNGYLVVKQEHKNNGVFSNNSYYLYPEGYNSTVSDFNGTVKSLTNNPTTTNNNTNNTNNTKVINKLKSPHGGVDNIKGEDSKLVEQVVGYLNKVTGANFSAKANNTVKLILARAKEGAVLDDFLDVIDIKFSEWGKDKKMKKYIRPSTLFCASHFDEYLNQTSTVNNNYKTYHINKTDKAHGGYKIDPDTINNNNDYSDEVF